MQTIATLGKIKQQLYSESPFDLGTQRDADFGTGVNYALENTDIRKRFDSHDDLVLACKDALAQLRLLKKEHGLELPYTFDMLEKALHQADLLS